MSCSLLVVIGASFWMAMTQITDVDQYNALMSIYTALGSLPHNLSFPVCFLIRHPGCDTTTCPRIRQQSCTGPVICNFGSVTQLYFFSCSRPFSSPLIALADN